MMLDPHDIGPGAEDYINIIRQKYGDKTADSTRATLVRATKIENKQKALLKIRKEKKENLKKIRASKDSRYAKALSHPVHEAHQDAKAEARWNSLKAGTYEYGGKVDKHVNALTPGKAYNDPQVIPQRAMRRKDVEKLARYDTLPEATKYQKSKEKYADVIAHNNDDVIIIIRTALQLSKSKFQAQLRLLSLKDLKTLNHQALGGRAIDNPEEHAEYILELYREMLKKTVNKRTKAAGKYPQKKTPKARHAIAYKETNVKIPGYP
jgi:hypothetical protein